MYKLLDFVVGWVVIGLMLFIAQFMVWASWHFILWMPLQAPDHTYWLVSRMLAVLAGVLAFAFARAEAEDRS